MIKRLALPLTLLAVAFAVVIMAQFLGGPLQSERVAGGLSVLLDPPAGAREPGGGIEHLDSRSGLIDYNALDARLTALMDDPAMTGLAVGIVENGEITFARGYGETLKGSGEPVTLDTVFRWASLSKGVAATMVTLLAQEGRVDLDAPISRYAPSLRLPHGSETRATVSNLLSHRLGIERNSYDNRLEDDEDPHALRSIMGALPAACPPGSCHRYQNVAFDAASEIVERVTGESYEAATRGRLFRPLGMASASLSRSGLQESASWARSHNRQGGEIEVVEPYYRIPAAGGMNGSILDLILWMDAQMGDTPRVVPRAVLGQTQARVVHTPRENRRNRRYLGRLTDSWYGLGWRIYDYAGHRVIAHRGAVRGYRAMIMFDPSLRSGVVVLSNSDSGRPFGIPIDFFDQLYRLPDGHWIESGAPLQPGQAAPPPPEPVEPVAPMIEGRRRPGDMRGSGRAS